MLAATRSNDLVRARAIKTATAVTALLALLGCGQPKATETSPTPPSTTEAVDVSALGAGLPSLTQRRVQDLYLVSKALERYHNSQRQLSDFQRLPGLCFRGWSISWSKLDSRAYRLSSCQGARRARASPANTSINRTAQTISCWRTEPRDCVPFATQTATTDVEGRQG